MVTSFTRILTYFLTFLMGSMVLAVTWQIFTRFILNDPSIYSEEIAGFLLIWIGMLGSTFALHKKSHIGIDILTKNLKGSQKVLSDFIISCIVILFALTALVIGGSRLVYITFTLNQISPALGIKMAYVYLVVPISGLIMITYSINFIKESLEDSSV